MIRTDESKKLEVSVERFASGCYATSPCWFCQGISKMSTSVWLCIKEVETKIVVHRQICELCYTELKRVFNEEIQTDKEG